ncbi:type II toxin-antitoxin system Phd/YefM family antitoxin [Kitasatospora sp. NPDC008115]|uniref:type II toxin-antitoxin system Phd/YefM family antitoxin n=1 Tax=Kitasatospora sp. NPDC008115 TaxID=3364022 RepID=UPI0036EFB9C4
MPEQIPVPGLQVSERLGRPGEPVVESSSAVRRHLAAVVERAGRGTPTIITRRGRQEAVLIGAAEYRWLKRVEAEGAGVPVQPPGCAEPGDRRERRRR